MKKVAWLALLILLLVSVPATLANDTLQQTYVGGYQGCFLVEVLGETLVGPYRGEGYVSYWAPSDTFVPVRFWSYDQTYGYGMLIVRYPSNTNQGVLFMPQAIDIATTWTQPGTIGTILLDPSAMYFPPANQVPAALMAVYPAACAPLPPPPPPIGITNEPGCTVDDIFLGVSTNPRLACDPVEGFAIDHFELVLNGVVIEGNLPDNQFDVWQRWNVTCAKFHFDGFWPDSSVGVIVVGENGIRYPYRVTVRSGAWRSNDYRTAICSFDETMTRVRPMYGDSVDIYLLALGLPVSRELKDAWWDTNDGLTTGVWYDIPQEWLAQFGQGVGQN
jgi:hypothetical protein